MFIYWSVGSLPNVLLVPFVTPSIRVLKDNVNNFKFKVSRPSFPFIQHLKVNTSLDPDKTLCTPFQFTKKYVKAKCAAKERDITFQRAAVDDWVSKKM